MTRVNMSPGGTRVKTWRMTGSSTLGELLRPAPRAIPDHILIDPNGEELSI